MEELTTFDMYLNDVRSCKVLPAKEVRDLITKAQKGDRIAREKIARANVKLVIKIAKEYASKYSMDLQELVASGNIGLAIAINKFNPSMGTAFTTYAQFWIRSEINNTMTKSHDIVLPKKRAKELSKEFNTYATSMDDENFNEGSVSEEYCFNLERNMENTLLSSYLDKALDCLTEMEAGIIRMHYGIGCEKMSFREIGDLYGYSKQYISHLEKKAISNLRGGQGIKYLDGYIA